jgi:hypothetical protein
MAVTRNIKYINRDFSTFRQTLIDYARTYFPNTYNDFTEASPGMMFIEMASYVGDVLSYYQDNQFQETFLQYARETGNLYDLAYMFGYKPRVTATANTTIDFYQQVPALWSSGQQIPDYSYALTIPANTQVQSQNNSNINFIIEDPVNFAVSSSMDPTTVTIYQQTGGVVDYFLLKKSRKAISANIRNITFTFAQPEEFATRVIADTNIIGILDIIDNVTGEKWYEVPHLADESVFISVANTNPNDPNLYVDQDAPNLLKLQGVPKRYATRFIGSGSLQVQFGAGSPNDTAELITPNPDNVGLGLPFEIDKLTTAFSPQNFVFNDTYGIAPSNDLTVRYLTGGGVTSNVPANNLSVLPVNTAAFNNFNLASSVLANYVFNSLVVNNSLAASGGGDGDTTEEIRQNSLANFNSQLRNVTQDDYLVRALSLPSEFGTIAKAYITKTKVASDTPGQLPSTLDLYILTFDVNGNLTTASTALKQNLITYLSQYRVIGDSINIKDAFIINIGVEFEITVRPNFNSNEVLRNCILATQEYFKLDNWQVNEPILLKEINLLLDAVEGVQTVASVTVNNKVGNALGYSQYAYDIEGATQNNTIYPSIDPMIFEVKYPNTDILGRVVNF